MANLKGYPIYLTRENVVGSNNNTLQAGFNSFPFTDHSIAVAGISIYYSWYNISAAFNNNHFSYTWPGIDSVFNITIPDGMYSIQTLNEFLQQYMIQQNQFLMQSPSATSTSTLYTNIYFIELLVDPAHYAVMVNTFKVPIAGTFPTTITAPANFPYSTGTGAYNPTITFPSSFNNIIGFPANYSTDPCIGGKISTTPVITSPPIISALSTNGTLSTIGNSSPDVQSNSTVTISCSNVDNKLNAANNTTIIYAFTPDCSVGSIYSEKAPVLLWCDLQKGTQTNLTITLNGIDSSAPLQILDKNIMIMLYIRDNVASRSV